MPPRTQRCPRSGQAVPWVLSCGCLENGVAMHMEIMPSRYERSFLPIPSRRFVCLALLIGGYFGRNIGAVSRFGALSDGSFAAAHSFHGLDNSKEWSETSFGGPPSSTGREHCRVTASSRRCRALW